MSVKIIEMELKPYAYKKKCREKVIAENLWMFSMIKIIGNLLHKRDKNIVQNAFD